MRRLAPAVALLAIAMIVTGCDARDSGRGAVSHQFGPDFFGAGGILNLTDPVAGDAVLAGGHVAIATEVKGDLVAGGGEVSIGGNVGDDVYAAGGTVRLDAIVTGNARLAGGEVAVGPATVVAGALSLTGGRVEFDGDTDGYLRASGGTVRLNGIVHGDASVRAEDVVVGPDTRIGGKLVVHGATQPEIAEGAVITGGVEFHATSPDRYFEDAGDTVRTVARGIGTVLWFAGVVLAGAIFLLVFPGFSSRAAATVGREPLKSLGLGVAVLLCVPVIGVLLVITVIGIPLALLLLPVYALLLFLGWVTAALFLGEKGLALLRGARPASAGWRLSSLGLALLALGLLGRIPHLGGWISMAALLAGSGALVLQAWQRRGQVLQAAV